MRFQQLTGPAMAKGVEDTAFYRYHRLIALNEVGGDPGRFGVLGRRVPRRLPPDRSGRRPRTLLATTTHDTKRSEDVRARLALLSEIPERWAEAVRRWAEHNAAPPRDLPDRNTEYLIYQTLVGAWPIDAGAPDRLPEKAVREAKLHTSWTQPDEAYEHGVRDFATAILGTRSSARPRGFVAPLVASRADQQPGADPDQAHRARRARHLPGHRAVGPQPGRPRQPPAGRLRAARALLAELDGARAGGDPGAHGRGSAQAVGDAAGPARCAARPAAASAAGATAARGPGAKAGARGGLRARRGSRPWCRGWSWAWRRLGRHRAALPPGDWRNVLTGDAGRRRGRTRRDPGAVPGGAPGAGGVIVMATDPGLGAASGQRWSWRPAGSGSPWSPDERLVAARRAEHRARRRLRLPARRRGPLPDPRSAWQPDGVHGPSRWVDHARFAWRDAGWRPPPLGAAVIYELHVGTFTPEGTFDGGHRAARPPRRPGRHPRGADAGGRVLRRPRLGLRRRRPLRAPSRLRRARRAQAPGRRLPPARPGRAARRGLQPPGARAATTSAASGPTSPTATGRPGARPSTSTDPTATRCAASSSTTP
jgi:hypothetical protein